MTPNSLAPTQVEVAMTSVHQIAQLSFSSGYMLAPYFLEPQVVDWQPRSILGSELRAQLMYVTARLDI